MQKIIGIKTTCINVTEEIYKKAEKEMKALGIRNFSAYVRFIINERVKSERTRRTRKSRKT